MTGRRPNIASERIIVCGSRRVIPEQAQETINTWFSSIWRSSYPISPTIVTGGARGVDTIAHEAAKSFWPDVDHEVFRADWRRWGPAAGQIRNQEMLNAGANRVIAFWDGHSRGTAHMLNIAAAAGVRTTTVRIRRLGSTND